MTTEQKVQIGKLRRENCGYATIAKILCVSVSSVKSYCQRNGQSLDRRKDRAVQRLWKDHRTNSRKKTKEVLFCCLPADMVEYASARGLPQGGLYIRLYSMWQDFFCLWQ